MAKPLPGLDVPVVDQQGRMTQAWYEYFQSKPKNLASQPDVSSIAPTNGQVLIYNSTTKLWTPGAN